MLPQQQHYQDILRQRGWLSPDGHVAWPIDERERRALARQLFGLDMVASLDACIESAEDEIYGTFESIGAKPERVSEEAAERRAIFSGMSEAQKQAVLDLVHEFGRQSMFGVCCHFDQFLGGGLTIQLAGTDKKDPEHQVRIHPGDFLDMHEEQLQWRNEFSRIYGGEYGEKA